MWKAGLSYKLVIRLYWIHTGIANDSIVMILGY